jgi:hypothetical protein
MIKKPLQPPTEFRKRETFVFGKAIEPPAKGGLLQKTFNPGDSIQKIRVI